MTLAADDPAVARFISYVDFLSDFTGCWEWAGTRNHGYGFFSYQGSNVLAHRFSWELFVGPIPAGKQILHHCDNPACVKPLHLFLGDNRANMVDRFAKGRKGAVGCKPERRAHLRLVAS